MAHLKIFGRNRPLEIRNKINKNEININMSTEVITLSRLLKLCPIKFWMKYCTITDNNVSKTPSKRVYLL